MIFDAEPGQHVKDFAEELVTLAQRARGIVEGRHNDFILRAGPNSTADDVLQPWRDHERRR